jgi:hypothetical protein
MLLNFSRTEILSTNRIWSKVAGENGLSAVQVCTTSEKPTDRVGPNVCDGSDLKIGSVRYREGIWRAIQVRCHGEIYHKGGLRSADGNDERI